jgi:hypothetical protein
VARTPDVDAHVELVDDRDRRNGAGQIDRRIVRTDQVQLVFERPVPGVLDYLLPRVAAMGKDFIAALSRLESPKGT